MPSPETQTLLAEGHSCHILPLCVVDLARISKIYLALASVSYFRWGHRAVHRRALALALRLVQFLWAHRSCPHWQMPSASCLGSRRA